MPGNLIPVSLHRGCVQCFVNHSVLQHSGETGSQMAAGLTKEILSSSQSMNRDTIPRSDTERLKRLKNPSSVKEKYDIKRVVYPY